MSSSLAVMLPARCSVWRWLFLALAAGSFCAAAQNADYQTHLSPTGSLAIVRHPQAADFQRGALTSIPTFNPQARRNPWQVDLRGYDVSKCDLEQELTSLLYACFDAKTRWPEKLPSGFDPAKIMELGKDPGLRVRALHAQGITGKGVGLGIIDQALLTDHIEYGKKLRLYEEIHCPNHPAQMHGPAVASIAVGESVGVAPGAELYYIAEIHGAFKQGGGFDWDFTWLAKSIDRLLEVNSTLPKDRKIRVISISVGWMRGQKGYEEVTRAVQHATMEGVFVISTALEETHSLAFHGLGREAMADPNAATSYGPGSWWAERFWDGARRFAPGQRLLVPMDARCVASPTGPRDYVYYSEGGWSWCVPWLAGLYALACEANPDITPERFWREALETGETTQISKGGAQIPFGSIVNPVALIRRIQAAGRAPRSP